jgi:hypothetical protein
MKKAKVFYTSYSHRRTNEPRLYGECYLDWPDMKQAMKLIKNDMNVGDVRTIYKITLTPVKTVTKTRLVKDLKNV